MRRLVVIATATTTLLTACAGRDPVPVSAYKPSDAKLSCTDLTAEIRANNQKMLTLARESADTTDRNVMVGAAGVLLFAPMLLAIDAKDAAATENRSYEARNEQLAELARQGGCEVPTPYTVAMAEEEIGRSRDKESSGAPKAGKDAQTSDAVDPAKRSADPQQTVLPGQRSDMQELMGRFLRGEISREEYERTRMQIASN